MEIAKAIAALVQRLAISEDVDVEISDVPEKQLPQPQASTSTLSLMERMNMAINHPKTVSPPNENTNNIKTIKREMTFYESENVKGQYLNQATQYLATIQPTSVESERAFSAAGHFCTKVRSRMQDKTLDKLCF